MRRRITSASDPWAGGTSARHAWPRLAQPWLPAALLRVGRLDHGHGAGRNVEPHRETRHLIDERMRLRFVGGDQNCGRSNGYSSSVAFPSAATSLWRRRADRRRCLSLSEATPHIYAVLGGSFFARIPESYATVLRARGCVGMHGSGYDGSRSKNSCESVWLHVQRSNIEHRCLSLYPSRR